MTRKTKKIASKTPALLGDRRRLNSLIGLGLPRYALLPGDPDRVNVMAGQWEDPRTVDLPRGYRAAVGTYKGIRLCAVSTGIGAPSLCLKRLRNAVSGILDQRPIPSHIGRDSIPTAIHTQ